ncbi:tyrosine-type recombinase/integrase [Spirosoma validum]|uniref:Tyrosine-type recombinase/integrase n=1 Tax=Spirosoma validum TaxID=2771355 RepID=A0A927AYA6_9BACT|nr:tyrosine-type recombinase/integrase [Spirosoma validum]MBD2752009.1 tyrosine-type recombinase/integrase [Spirosoma validum]
MSTPQLKSMALTGPMVLSGQISPMTWRRRMPISIRFALRPPKKGRSYSNQHPLQVWITINRQRVCFGAVWCNQKLLVNPADWRVHKQASARRVDPVNAQITSMKAYIEGVFHRQRETGGVPSVESVQNECLTGLLPEWSSEHGWVYLHDKTKRRNPNQYANCLSANSPLDEAYIAYIAHLQQQGADKILSRVSLGRWKRGLRLLNEFAAQTNQQLPTAGSVSVGWAKRYHIWLQTQDGGRNRSQPVGAAQASRFVLKVSAVLRWMIEEDWIHDNPIARVRWPKATDKEVQFLEPGHVHQLLQMDHSGIKGMALWWFCLMCCTGLDFPDALAYARNRKAYEVIGPEGLKLVGRRKKPPHNEYHLPLLDEVEQLFAIYPTGPHALSAQYVNRYTDHIETVLGISWRITVKTARKTFGCLMLAAGHRIADVSLMLGHASIAITERHYVKVRAASIDRSMKRVKVDISQLVGDSATRNTNPFIQLHKTA